VGFAHPEAWPWLATIMAAGISLPFWPAAARDAQPGGASWWGGLKRFLKTAWNR
jgi:hypothetical protein